MTPAPAQQKEYICNEDDLGCLHDYFVAAIAGEDISELPRLWNQEIGVIRSRPYTSASSDKVLDVLEQWHYDEINRFKLKRPSTSNYLPSIKAHEQSIKRMKELRQQTKVRR